MNSRTAQKPRPRFPTVPPPQQIEHWAQIGRVLEPALSYQTETAIKRVGRPELDAVLDEIGTPEATARTQAIIRRTSGAIASTDS